MKKALVFVAAFVLVLSAGVAVALMTTPSEGTSAGEQELTTTTEVAATTEATEPDEPVVEEPAGEGDDVVSDREEEEPVDQKDGTGEDEPEEDNTSPHIEILYPEDGQHFEKSKIAFEGVTEPGARVYAGDYEADVDEEGNWRIVLILWEGGNTATLTAVDESGNEASASVHVYYDPPAEEPKDVEEPKETTDFTAHQKYGSCGETPPYDVWYGTGEPGTEVFVGSEFGSADTVIGEAGKWDLEVVFEGAPCGEPIKVVLETNTGERKVYEFVHLCEEGGGGEK